MRIAKYAPLTRVSTRTVERLIQLSELRVVRIAKQVRICDTVPICSQCGNVAYEQFHAGR
jgi:hypothetical protein